MQNLAFGGPGGAVLDLSGHDLIRDQLN
jgi:hypothetical protein